MPAHTVRTQTIKGTELRLLEDGARVIGMVIRDGNVVARIEGEEREPVWQRLQHEHGKANPRYFGFSGALARFERLFPEGFSTPRYAEFERDHKIAAKAKLDRAAPLDAALEGLGFGDAVLSVFQATDLLSRFEKTRIHATLRSAQADAFVHASAHWTLHRDPASLRSLEQILRVDRNATWPVLTYLPYLWRPDLHMLLKPKWTQDFAERVGHPFIHCYEASLKPTVYESLLDLVETTRREIAVLQPRDNIDVQSFIWAVGAYPEDQETRPASRRD